jgi:ergothioneine biosynthesis protein EgtB
VALRQHPTLVRRLRVVDTLGPSTIQPIVAARHLPDSIKVQLREMLVEMHRSRPARAALAHGCVERFVAVKDSDYNDIRAMLHVSHAAGEAAIMTDRSASGAALAIVESNASLLEKYRVTRHQTEALCEPLATEDYVVQSMPDASPVKWHLAHTTWFFETFVLAPLVPSYRLFHPQFSLLFNSYYTAVGPRWPRAERGLLSRPTVAEVFRYRAYVDERLTHLLQSARPSPEVEARTILGVNHEQQHQELILTDLKHAWAANPMQPVYRETSPDCGEAPGCRWLSVPEGLVWIGHNADGFSFDNECPRHRSFLKGFQMASRLVTNEEFMAFIADGGYDRPELWLSDGWANRQNRGWTAPLYWERQGMEWSAFTLGGRRPPLPAEPVCHISYYEADAFARWAGARLPSEAEWETAAGSASVAGHFLESGRFHPAATPVQEDCGPLIQLYGDIWQWTASPYLGYPGYRPPSGALGEYNAKFTCNQFVLRGASCATPRTHARRTYRNFFPPEARWQFTGLRLASDPQTEC